MLEQEQEVIKVVWQRGDGALVSAVLQSILEGTDLWWGFTEEERQVFAPFVVEYTPQQWVSGYHGTPVLAYMEDANLNSIIARTVAGESAAAKCQVWRCRAKGVSKAPYLLAVTPEFFRPLCVEAFWERGMILHHSQDWDVVICESIMLVERLL